MDEQTVLRLIREGILELPVETQFAVRTAAVEIRATLKSYGDAGMMALALVGAETAATIPDGWGLNED